MAEGKASRSTVLQPLFMIGIALLTALCGTAAAGTSQWLVVTLAAMFGLVLLVFVFTFIWFALRDPSALRTEKYLIRKMELQQAAIGDSLKVDARVDVQSDPKHLFGEPGAGDGHA
jgi:type IV secretory pathway TrbD component